MKILIASDIHGSAYYCQVLLDALEREKADRLFLLGDILYHGPRNDLPRDYAPKEVIAMLNPLKEKLFCVRGNCDTEVDQMVLNFPILADYAILPLGYRVIYATHGHKFFCDNPDCDFTTFAERFDFLAQNGKKTKRLIDKIVDVSLNTSSVAASKTLRNGIADVGKSTICNLLKKRYADSQ